MLVSGFRWICVLLIAGLHFVAVQETDDEIPTQCPTIDPMHTTIHLAHENDCTMFYKCHAGKRFPFHCPFMDAMGHRLHFNPRLQVCDWPLNARCVSGWSPASTTVKTTLPTTTSPTTTTEPTTPEIITTTTTPTTSTTRGTTTTEPTTPEIITTTTTPTTSTTRTTTTTEPTTPEIITTTTTPTTSTTRTTTTTEPTTPEIITTTTTTGTTITDSTTTTVNPSVYPGCLLDPPSIIPQTSSMEQTSLSNIFLPSLECPATGEHDVPHPTACDLYYHCVSGERKLELCQENATFNICINNCDLSDTSICYAHAAPPQ